MTYEEIREKLGKCERSLSALQSGNYANIPSAKIPSAITQLQVMKEELENKLVILEQEKTAFVNGKAVEYEDEQELTVLKNNSDVDSIKTAKGKKIKEAIKENIQISIEQTKAVAKKAGMATLKALKNMGEGISTSKAKRIVPGKFEIFVQFKNGTSNIYEFIIDSEDKLHLDNKMVGEIGVQPSGEAILHVDVVAGNIQTVIKSGLRETNDYNEQLVKESCKVGDILTKDGKKGKVIKHSETQATVDFGNGDVYGIAHSRIKDGKILNEANDNGIILSNEILNFLEEREMIDPSDAQKVHKDLTAFLKSKMIKQSNLAEDKMNREKIKGILWDLKNSNKLSNPSDPKKKEALIKKLEKQLSGLGESLNEAPYQTTYIKFPGHQYKKAMDILNTNIDPTYVKMDIVDNDGDGNVIVYFNFKHEAGFDDMYDDSENPDSEFYQEPEENPEEFLYDVVMDLRANDIEMTGMSHDVDDMDELAESSESDFLKRMNNPASMKWRAKAPHKNSPSVKTTNPNWEKEKGISPKKKAIIDKLKAKRAQVMRDMEQEAEPEGGPIADKYGDILNKIDTALEKAKGQKQMSYDDAIGEGEDNEKSIQGQELVDYIMNHWNWSEEKTLKWLGNNFNKPKEQDPNWKTSPEYIAYLRRNGRGEYADELLGTMEESENDDSLFTFGFDLDAIEYVVNYLESKYKEGVDYELHIGRGDDMPNAVTLINTEMENDSELGDLLDVAKGDDQTDYEDYRREEDDYANNELEEDTDIGHEDDEPSMLLKKESLNPEVSRDVNRYIARTAKRYDYSEQDAVYAIMAALKQRKFDGVNEDLDLGHEDDEPSMLKASALETAEYAAKLHKKLAAYDQQDGEVDFPHWWQKKLILAREYVSSAFHYLSSAEKQPALDQLALEENVDKVAGGIPYRQHGNKVIISEPLDDATKERLLGKAKEYGYFAQPNMAGGITITLKRGMHKEASNLEGKTNTSEASINKLQKGHDDIVKHMKELAKLYKAGDTSVVGTLKDLSARKKELEKLLDKKVAGTGRDQELSINESAALDLDEIFGALGYRQGFDEFIEDNPGCVEVIMEWLGSISEFRERLSSEFDKEELENLGFYYGDDDEDEYNEAAAIENEDDYYDDYFDIGYFYLEGLGKKHSLTSDEMVALGKKIVSSKYKGDVGKAYDKIVNRETPSKFKQAGAASGFDMRGLKEDTKGKLTLSSILKEVSKSKK